MFDAHNLVEGLGVVRRVHLPALAPILVALLPPSAPAATEGACRSHKHVGMYVHCRRAWRRASTRSSWRWQTCWTTSAVVSGGPQAEFGFFSPKRIGAG